MEPKIHHHKGCWRLRGLSKTKRFRISLKWDNVTCMDCLRLKPKVRKFGPYLHATVAPTPTNHYEGELDSFGGGL